MVEDKVSLQNTISSLSDEIESLSVKNEEFLGILSIKDFYKEYQLVQEELNNLKDAHAILINMIKDEELQVQSKRNIKEYKLGESDNLIKDTSTILGSDISKISKSSIEKEERIRNNRTPLSEINLTKGRNSTISSLFGCNAFNGLLSRDKLKEHEMDLKHDKKVKNNAEFLSDRLQNVDINFLNKT